MLSSTQELETVAVNRDAVGNNDDARLLRESIASPLQGHDMKDGIRRFRMSVSIWHRRGLGAKAPQTVSPAEMNGWRLKLRCPLMNSRCSLSSGCIPTYLC